MAKSKLYLICGALLVAAGGYVQMNAMAWWGARVDADWVWEPMYVGVLAYADENGEFPEDFDPSESRRIVSLIEAESGATLLQDIYQVLDIRTKEVTWETRQTEPIDLVTGRGPMVNGQVTQVLFPRFTEQTSYLMGLGYLTGISMDFVREEEVAGLDTYLFGYEGHVEYTSSYASTDNYDGIPVEDGQEVWCIDDKFIFNAWVEPVTGEIVKYEESCYSGDALFDVASGENLMNLARRGGETLSGSVQTIAAQVRTERARLLFLIKYLWIIMAGLGALVMAAGWVARRIPDSAPAAE